MSIENNSTRQAPQSWRDPQYLLWILAIFLLIGGIAVLLFTTGWLSIDKHYPIILIAIALSGWIGIERFRVMFRTPIPSEEVEKLRKWEEQIVDEIVKRAGRYALLLGVITFGSLKIYMDGIYGDPLKKVSDAVETLDRFYDDYDSLKKGLEASERRLSELDQKYKESKKIIDAMVPEFRSRQDQLDRIGNEAKQELQRIREVRENTTYRITIHHSANSRQDGIRIQAALERLGFFVSLMQHDQSEVDSHMNQLIYHQDADQSKVSYVKNQLRDFKFVLNPRLVETENPRNIDLWH